MIIFDFDGTPADTFPRVTNIGNQVADKYGIKKVAENEREILRGLGAREIFRYMGVPLWRVPMIAYYAIKLLSKDIGNISLFNGVDSLLKNLSKSEAALAILSTNSFANISIVLGLEHTARIEYFECGASLFGKRAKLQKLLRKSKALPGEAIYIGDEIRDYDAANQVGVAFGAVSWGYTRIEALETHKPMEVFTSVD